MVPDTSLADSAASIDFVNAALVIVSAVVFGQMHVLYRFSRVGGGPGTYRRTLRSRYKQYRSVYFMDFISGIVVVSGYRAFGPRGPVNDVLGEMGFLGWVFLGAIAPFGFSGFLRGTVVEGLLAPRWLREGDPNRPLSLVYGIYLYRAEAVDLLVRELWISVRDANRAKYRRLKACAEGKARTGEVLVAEFVLDVEDYFGRIQKNIPPSIADAIRLTKNDRSGEFLQFDALISHLLNAEFWEPVERICGRLGGGEVRAGAA